MENHIHVYGLVSTRDLILFTFHGISFNELGWKITNSRGIYLTFCLSLGHIYIYIMSLKTSECALSNDIWVVTFTYIVLCEQQAFLWRILFQIPLKTFYTTTFTLLYFLLCKRHVFNNSIMHKALFPHVGRLYFIRG